MEYATASTPRISVSMPNDGSVLDHRTVHNYFSNLLPDNEETRAAWAREFSDAHHPVSWRNPFALLTHMGRDVAGALEIVPDGEGPRQDAAFIPVSSDEIASRIRTIASRPTAGARAHAHARAGRFSLAGAQDKFALTSFDGGRSFYEPTGAFPSTHIFKPHVRGLDGQALVEQVSMQTAHHAGLSTAKSEFREFAGQGVLVSTRYDRRVENADVVRLHQEDLCQALGMPPERKYQGDGGPSPHGILRLLRQEAGEADGDAFVRSLAFAWAIANTDGHAKNYSLLHDEEGNVRLAPLYDICSYWPFEPSNPAQRNPVNGRAATTPALAFKIGDTDKINAITQDSWVLLARKADIDPDRVLTIVTDTVQDVPDALERALSESGDTSNEHLRAMCEKTLRQAERSLSTMRSGRRAAPTRTPLSRRPAGAAPGPGYHFVRPHVRGGHPVEGFWRPNPKRG